MNTCRCGEPARPRVGKRGPAPATCSACQREMRRSAVRAWEARNAEIDRQNKRDWQRSHPAKLVEYTRRYRAKKRAVAAEGVGA